MEKVKLGSCGVEVSRLCFGSLTMAPQQANMPPEKGAELLLHAFSRGVNYIDTAQLYDNYSHIRLALKKWNGGDIVLQSKTYAYNRALAVEAVEQARRALDRDVIDIFMLHEQESIHTLRGHAEALEQLFEYKARGVIRAVGVSMHHVAAAEGVCRHGDIDVIHPMLNVEGAGIVDGGREDMERAIKKAHCLGIGVVSMKPFGGGALFRRADECLDYLLSLDYVDAVAIGMQTIEEIDANIDFFEKGAFDAAALGKIRARERRLMIMDWCEACGDCVRACKNGAMSIDSGAARVDPSKCVLCGYCAARCKNACIKVV